MSADLLRRAAVKLRESAEAATEGPWTAESRDLADSGNVLYLCFAEADERGHRVIPFRTETEDAGYFSQAEADIAYAVLMHPPVALALADWLDLTAELNESLSTPLHALAGAEEALAVARAVLREVPT